MEYPHLYGKYPIMYIYICTCISIVYVIIIYIYIYIYMNDMGYEPLAIPGLNRSHSSDPG